MKTFSLLAILAVELVLFDIVTSEISGLFTASDGFGCEYDEELESDQGPRSIVISCKDPREVKPAYGCTYRGQPQVCLADNKNPTKFYKQLIDQAAATPGGACAFSTLVAKMCPDVDFDKENDNVQKKKPTKYDRSGSKMADYQINTLLPFLVLSSYLILNY